MDKKKNSREPNELQPSLLLHDTKLSEEDNRNILAETPREGNEALCSAQSLSESREKMR